MRMNIDTTATRRGNKKKQHNNNNNNKKKNKKAAAAAAAAVTESLLHGVDKKKRTTKKMMMMSRRKKKAATTRQQQSSLSLHSDLLNDLLTMSNDSGGGSGDGRVGSGSGSGSGDLLFEMRPFDDGGGASAVLHTSSLLNHRHSSASGASGSGNSGMQKKDDGGGGEDTDDILQRAVAARVRAEMERQQQQKGAVGTGDDGENKKKKGKRRRNRMEEVEEALPAMVMLHQLEKDSLRDPRSHLEYAPGCFFHSQCTASSSAEQQRLNVSKGGNALQESEQRMSAVRTYGWSNVFSSKRITCRCFDCEMRKVEPCLRMDAGSVAGTARGPSSHTAAPVRMVIVVDLDNVGFNEFAAPCDAPGSAPASAMSAATVAQLSNESWMKIFATEHAFLWGFYGGLFLDHVDKVQHQDLLTRLEACDFEVNRREQGQDGGGSGGTESLFECFAIRRHLRISNCGAKKQAADTAIIKTVHHITTHHPAQQVVVVSRDNNLLLACHTFYGPDQPRAHRPLIAARPSLPSDIMGMVRSIAMKM